MLDEVQQESGIRSADMTAQKLVAMRGARGDVFERLHSEFCALEQRKTAIRSHIDIKSWRANIHKRHS